jgi:hypothetical protein
MLLPIIMEVNEVTCVLMQITVRLYTYFDTEILLLQRPGNNVLRAMLYNYSKWNELNWSVRPTSCSVTEAA